MAPHTPLEGSSVPDVHTISSTGAIVSELQGTSGAFRDELNNALNDALQLDLKKLTFSFKGVKILDSTSLGILLSFRRQAQTMGLEVVICDLNPHIREVLHVTRMAGQFIILESERSSGSETV